MSDGEPCKRLIHPAPERVDPELLCLMHSENPKKDPAQFQEEIRAIIDGTSTYNRRKDTHDFTRFVFPVADFSFATFTQNADFSGAKFTQNADFSGAKFTQKADFSGAKFTQNADFNFATFTQNADFRGATFTQKADFNFATFTQHADFRAATFTQNTHFLGATFTQNADFNFATFTQKADFRAATFTQNADFSAVTFTEAVEFSFVTFGPRKEAAGAVATASNGPPVIAEFRGTRFIKPAEVRFFQANKNCHDGLRVRFRNCEVEAVDFTDVHWHQPGRRMVLQDEIDTREGKSQEYEAVAVAYRQLVNNFEKGRAYDLAEDCFIGAMEMKRLDPRNSIFGRLGRWLSVVNLYRLLSNYGSSYARALGCLVVFLLLFAVLFPAFGLRMSGDSLPRDGWQTAAPASAQTSTISWGLALGHPQRGRELWRIFKAGLWASLEVATFQKDPTVKAADTWGRRLAVVEDIAVPGQLALFLLSLRRRFRR